MDTGREAYVARMHRAAGFLNAVAAASREHGVHLRPTEGGGLAVVSNDDTEAFIPVRFSWDGDDYSPVR